MLPSRLLGTITIVREANVSDVHSLKRDGQQVHVRGSIYLCNGFKPECQPILVINKVTLGNICISDNSFVCQVVFLLKILENIYLNSDKTVFILHRAP